MLRILTTLAAIGAVSTPALADDHADYGVNFGFSPFGGSVGLIYNHTASTSFNVAFGGAPASDAPFKLDIDGTEYTQNGGSSWMGFFLNHRPFEDSQWFRINTGIGIGGIEGTLTNDAGDEYAVEYNENPVGYIGVGFETEPLKASPSASTSADSSAPAPRSPWWKATVPTWKTSKTTRSTATSFPTSNSRSATTSKPSVRWTSRALADMAGALLRSAQSPLGSAPSGALNHPSWRAGS